MYTINKQVSEGGVYADNEHDEGNRIFRVGKLARGRLKSQRLGKVYGCGDLGGGGVVSGDFRSLNWIFYRFSIFSRVKSIRVVSVDYRSLN